MIFLKPKPRDYYTKLTADELKTIKALRSDMMRVSEIFRLKASRAEKRATNSPWDVDRSAAGRDKWDHVDRANAVAETCLGLERIEREGGTKVELVGEFSPLACDTLSMRILPLIAVQFDLAIATEDPGLFAYPETFVEKAPITDAEAEAEAQSLSAKLLEARARHAAANERRLGRLSRPTLADMEFVGSSSKAFGDGLVTQEHARKAV
jgi:hypothetical protein